MLVFNFTGTVLRYFLFVGLYSARFQKGNIAGTLTRGSVQLSWGVLRVNTDTSTKLSNVLWLWRHLLWVWIDGSDDFIWVISGRARDFITCDIKPALETWRWGVYSTYKRAMCVCGGVDTTPGRRWVALRGIVVFGARPVLWTESQAMLASAASNFLTLFQICLFCPILNSCNSTSK